MFHRSVQPIEQAFDASFAFGDDAPVVSRLEKPLKPSVFECPDHGGM
jgi:hypothetical protein